MLTALFRNRYAPKALKFVLTRALVASVLSGSTLCFSQATSPQQGNSQGEFLRPVPQLELNFLKETPVNDHSRLDLWRPASQNAPSAAVANPAANQTNALGGNGVDFHQPTSGQSVPGFFNTDSHSSAETSPTQVYRPALNESADEAWARDVVAEGSQYSAQDRWSEALGVYQSALREHPDSQLILKYRQNARIQVDLRQRLSDQKYLMYARTDTPEYAMASYNEILSKIHAFHVAEPDWNMMARHGLDALLAAFENEKFQQAFGSPQFAQTQKATAEILRVNLANYNVSSRTALLSLVQDIARLTEDKSGLRQAVTIHEFASSAISALDTYSSYLSPGHFEDVNSQIRGNFVGIGVELKATDDCLEIVKVIPGGPADQARIRAGDKMLAVNGQMVSEIGGDPAADLLKGTEGSELTAVVETPEGKQYRLRIIRRQIEIPSIEEAVIVDAEQGIGYIKLANFQKNTLSEFDYAMQMLSSKGMKALVLDLRENPGGVLDVSVSIANRFLTGGVIVSTRGRNPLENAVHPASAQRTWSMPLVVLINEHSASASEILAAAIADHHRGTIVGKKSFGKGSVQGIFALASGRGGIRLTTAKFYSPNGREIHQQGVTPDFTVQQMAKPNLDDNSVNVGTPEPTEDTAKIAAIKIARTKMTPQASIQASAAAAR